jgi:hypothetical protein
MTLSHKKVGPIHFLRVGSFCASWSIKTRPVTKRFTGSRDVIVVTGRGLVVVSDKAHK